MKDLTLSNKFQFDEIAVHIEFDETGNPLFRVRDVCAALGYANPRQQIRRHVDPEDVTKRDTLTTTGNKTSNFINESGLYSLILASKLGTAKRFKRWVTSEVLPTIRRTGSYSAKPLDRYEEEILSLKKMVFQHEQALSVGQSYKKIAKLLGCSESLANAETVQYIKRNLGIDATPLLAVNVSDDKEALATPTEIGKAIGLKAHEVNKELQRIGLQVRIEQKPASYKWELTPIGHEYAQIFNVGKSHGNGSSVQQIKWFKKRTINVIRENAFKGLAVVS